MTAGAAYKPSVMSRLASGIGNAVRRNRTVEAEVR
jgi:hypothetical protein